MDQYNRPEPAPTPGDARPPSLDWSVVVPAYNEEQRLAPSLEAILAYLQDAAPSSEVIVVDDGSVDATAEIVRERFPQVRLLSNPGNRGKGYSVRAGMLEARGRFVLFTDADLSTPIQELARFERELDAGADIVIASRALPESVLEVRQPLWREMSGRIFNVLVRLVSGLPFHDTQCGFKAYRREASRLIAQRQSCEGWAFDIEHLHLARLMGLKVREIPVHWINSPASRVSLMRDAPRMLLDTLRIRLRKYGADLVGAEEESR